MKITFNNVLSGSDLVIHEQDPFVAYTRAITEVTLTAGQKLQLGAVVFRAKAAAPGKYTPLTSAAALVATNEFAVYYADQLGQILPTEGVGDFKVASFVRGSVILKDKAIYDAVTVLGFAMNDVQKGTLKNLLAAQGVVVEKVLG